MHILYRHIYNIFRIFINRVVDNSATAHLPKLTSLFFSQYLFKFLNLKTKKNIFYDNSH